MGFGTADIEGVIQSYANYLRLHHPNNLPAFETLRTSDKEAALSESITFGILQTMGVHPSINEDAGTGGTDFICTRRRGPLFAPMPEDRFVVEATSLNPEAVTARSHIPNEVPDTIRGGAIGLVTQNICNKAKDKATQLANYPMPRILAIACSHFGVAVLFDSMTAEHALVSDPHWRQEIGSNVVDRAEYTDLERSIFIKPGPDGTIVACRKSISAILLVAVYGDKSEVYGILHPEPAYALDVRFLPGIPFIRIARWPIVGGKIFTEWVVGDPDGFKIPHFAIDPR